MAPRIRHVIFDFDGTCTQVDKVQAKFLADYRAAIGADDKPWEAAKARITKASPNAGWNLMNAPSTAPAGADPYILAGEAAALLYRERKQSAPDVFAKVYEQNTAPFRPEMHDVIEALLKKKVQVAFISNSDATKISNRIQDLFHKTPHKKDQIQVFGGAQKFLVKELLVDSPATAAQRAQFDQLAPGVRIDGVARPIYLRRGAYFEALCATQFPLAETLVVGDIWELDLAMPAALGAHVHLIQRAEPFPTYAYELAQVAKGQSSANLKGLLKRV
ncbi:MAG: HAD family hydrolase [Deltaproteobacteria bacterium]